jgi:hypothetical protein
LASFSFTFLPLAIVTSLNIQVPLSLSRIIMCTLLSVCNLLVP